MNKHKAFAFVELLIVVALIAMLAIVATPRFKQAQLSSQVAQASVRMRTVSKALESYAYDHNEAYPWDGQSQIPMLPSSSYLGCDIPTKFGSAHLNNMLTSPVAYLTTEEINDPFMWGGSVSTFRFMNIAGTYCSSSDAGRQASGGRYKLLYGSWELVSVGPDHVINTMDPTYSPTAYWALIPYDPTNGMLSAGDIVVSQRSASGKRPNALP